MRLIATLFFVVAANSALAVTIDFEDEALEYQGFRVSEYAIDQPGGVGIVGNEENKYASFYNVFLTVERTDGGMFSLHSYDYQPIAYGFGICGIGGVIGETASGEILNFSVSHSACNGWQTLTLGVEWTQLVRVSFEPIVVDLFSEGRIDNIVVSNVVPLPAAVWLFGSALAGLGWLRRKQTV
jgi:hypothetical protein